MCRALIDSGTGGSYASVKLIKLIDKKLSETKLQRVDTLIRCNTGGTEFYDVEVSSLDGNFKMDVKLAKVEKPELMSINNPGYEKLIRKYNHLKDVIIERSDEKDELPIHLVLGNANMYASKRLRDL